MDEVGIVYASIRKVLRIVAAITAKPIASIQLLTSLFFFLAFFFFYFQNCHEIVSQNKTSPAISGIK